MSRIGYALLQHYECACGAGYEWWGLTRNRTMFSRILRHKWGTMDAAFYYGTPGCSV